MSCGVRGYIYHDCWDCDHWCEYVYSYALFVLNKTSKKKNNKNMALKKNFAKVVENK